MPSQPRRGRPGCGSLQTLHPTAQSPSPKPQNPGKNKKLKRLMQDAAKIAAKLSVHQVLCRLPLLPEGRAAFVCRGNANSQQHLQCVVFECSSKDLQQQEQQQGQQHKQQQQEQQYLLEQLLALTKANMQDLYDKSNFLGFGWNTEKKLEELSHPDAHFWLVFEGTSTTLEEAAKCPLVAFLHFRFEVEESQPVAYLYELQTQAKYQCRSVGRRLVLMLEVNIRRLNRDMQCLRYNVRTNKLIDTEAAAATAAADSAAESGDQLLLPIHTKKIMCTVLRCNTRAMSFYKEKCGYTSDESCPYLLLQLQQQQQHVAEINASSSEEEEPEYEILKREINV